MNQSKLERRRELERKLTAMRHAYLVHGNEKHGGTVVPSACPECQQHLKGIIEFREQAKDERVNLR